MLCYKSAASQFGKLGNFPVSVEGNSIHVPEKRNNILPRDTTKIHNGHQAVAVYKIHNAKLKE